MRQRIGWLIVVWGMFAAFYFTMHPLRPHQSRLAVRAYIDGSDDLKIQGDRVWWSHHDWDLPGRNGGKHEPTYLNDQPWQPVWQDRRESAPTRLPDPLPASGDVTVTLAPVSGRGPVRLTQTPSAANGYTLSVLFDDNDQGGADWYDITLTWND